MNKKVLHTLEYDKIINLLKNEATKISKEIEPENSKEWAKHLLNLKIGESIAVGDFRIDYMQIKYLILLN